MTDRELLRLSAIACGELSGEWRNNEAYFDGVLSRWNPLEDDGDALRLAVRLGININFGSHDEGAVVAFDFTGRFSDCEESGDPYAATRRAIVCAAAEIGRAMP